MDENATESQAEAVEAVPENVEVAAAPLEPQGFFSLHVEYREGTTEPEIEAAMNWVKVSADQLASAPEDLLPHCVKSYTVTRDR